MSSALPLRNRMRRETHSPSLRTEPDERFQLRPAHRDDSVELMKLMVKFNRSEGIPWRPKRVAPALHRLLDDVRLGRVLLAFDLRDSSLVGYCVATFNFDLEFAGLDAFVTELFVAERCRGSGLGRLLLEAMATRVRTDGAMALHLLVSPENVLALRLYRGAGFVEVPRLMMTRTFPKERSSP
jgi:ribosomal protein S18 acetylase RimI-like enzyme